MILKKLIDEYCPDGVEYKPFSEVAGYRRGTMATRKSLTDGDIPVLAGGQTPAYYCDKSNRDGETIVVAGSGAYAGFVSYWDIPIFVSDAFTVEPGKELLPKYLYYFLKTKQDYIFSTLLPNIYFCDIETEVNEKSSRKIKDYIDESINKVLTISLLSPKNEITLFTLKDIENAAKLMGL